MPAQTHSAFVVTDRREPPLASVKVVPVSTRGSSALWRVDLEIAGAAFGPRADPPAERRVVTPALRRRARGRSEPLPFRPAWADQTFTPIRGPLVPRHRVLHRGKDLEPLFVFPPDRRFVYSDQNYPWRCVGRIVVPGAIGSGVLIGPRHVLTASHVMNWSNLSAQFTVDQFDNSNLGSSSAIAVWHYDKISNVNTDNVEQDYIVLVLAKPLGETLGWLGSREYDDDWDDEPFWSSIGYASDMGGMDRPVFQDDITLEEEDGGDMKVMTSTTGDFVPMQSGSPVFGWWTKGPYAVGVASAQGQGKNWMAGGQAMVDMVKTARAEDP
jgi:V8-like Glu-specific endopeptidase